jgi:hypothetical protein
MKVVLANLIKEAGDARVVEPSAKTSEPSTVP